MDLTGRVNLLERAYRFFNARTIDGLLAMMTDDVEWPDVVNGTVLDGKASIRSYWEAQFAVTDPRVVPTDFLPVGGELVAIVDQHVLDLRGEPLVPSTTVFHRYTFRDERVRRMVVFDDRAEAARP